MGSANLNNEMFNSIRNQILITITVLVLISLFGLTLSLYRIMEASERIDAINEVAIPLGKLITQLESDIEVLEREMDKNLGYSRWSDKHWIPRPVPDWIANILENEIEQSKEIVSSTSSWTSFEEATRWRAWAHEMSDGFQNLKTNANNLHASLKEGDHATAAKIYPQWISSLESWVKEIRKASERSDDFVSKNLKMST